jgi:WD40 repeat protein
MKKNVFLMFYFFLALCSYNISFSQIFKMADPPNTYIGWDGHKGPISFVSSNSKESLSASIGMDCTIRICDTKNQKIIKTLNAHLYSLCYCAFSSDGKLLYSADESGFLKIWDTHTWEILYERRIYDPYAFSIIKCITSSNDGTLMAVAYSNKIDIFNTVDFSIKKNYTIDNSTPEALAFSPNGNILASCLRNGFIRIWEIKNDSIIANINTDDFTTFKVLFSPDGTRLISGGAKYLSVWSTTDFKLLKILDTLYDHRSISITSDNKFVITLSNSGIGKWDINSGERIFAYRRNNSTSSISLCENESLILSGSSDGYLSFFSLSDGKIIDSISAHSGGVYSICLSHDGKTIATGGLTEDIILWDAYTGKPINTLKGHYSQIRIIKFSPTDQFIASGSNDFSARLWSSATGKLLKTLYFYGDINSVSTLDFSPDEKTIAAGGIEYFKLWDITQNSELYNIWEIGICVSSVSFSPDGNKIIIGDMNDTLKIWDVKSKSEIKSYKAGMNNICYVKYSPDGLTFLCCGGDNSIKVFDANTGSLLRTYSGLNSYSRFAQYFLDQKHILFLLFDGSINILETSTGKIIKTIKTDLPSVFSITQSPDEKKIYVGGNGYNNIRIYDISDVLSTKMREKPSGYSISGNYPNPFNPTTKIRYSIPKHEYIDIILYDQLGREVKTIEKGYKQPDIYELTIDCSGLSSGIYYYKFSAGNFNKFGKLIYLK